MAEKVTDLAKARTEKAQREVSSASIPQAVDLRYIALHQLSVVARQLAFSPPYLLINYNPDGTYRHPRQNERGPIPPAALKVAEDLRLLLFPNPGDLLVNYGDPQPVAPDVLEHRQELHRTFIETLPEQLAAATEALIATGPYIPGPAQ